MSINHPLKAAAVVRFGGAAAVGPNGSVLASSEAFPWWRGSSEFTHAAGAISCPLMDNGAKTTVNRVLTIRNGSRNLGITNSELMHIPPEIARHPFQQTNTSYTVDKTELA